jgi:hypothetical protein
MTALSVFGQFAVTAMLVCYAPEERSPWFVFGFAIVLRLGLHVRLPTRSLAVRPRRGCLEYRRHRAVASRGTLSPRSSSSASPAHGHGITVDRQSSSLCRVTCAAAASRSVRRERPVTVVAGAAIWTPCRDPGQAHAAAVSTKYLHDSGRNRRTPGTGGDNSQLANLLEFKPLAQKSHAIKNLAESPRKSSNPVTHPTLTVSTGVAGEERAICQRQESSRSSRPGPPPMRSG